jgi:cell division protein FtsL
MDYVHKLPFILGASMAVIIGVVSNRTGVESKAIYIRMSVGLVVFFILGLYIRGSLYKIDEEIRKRKEEELKQKEELENDAVDENGKHSVDYRIDDNSFEVDISPENDEKIYDEEFTPLNVNSVNITKDAR